MKALTIRQPFASFIIAGLKRWETRSWRTSHKGEILIHAALGHPLECTQAGFDLRSACQELLHCDLSQLPRGRIIGSVELVHCHSIDDCFGPHPTDLERSIGNWKHGHFAWDLINPKPLRGLPMRGKLGLWDLSDALLELQRRKLEFEESVDQLTAS
jgi:hypothetical protein